MEDLVSIIVPVYNAEKHLEQCIESIISQKYRNTEIMLVDDGSIDRSGAICDHFAKIDSRIKVLHQNNSGVSAARNNAIDVSKGQWLMFVDSDDYLKGDIITKFIQLAKSHPNDIVQCNYQTVDEYCRIMSIEPLKAGNVTREQIIAQTIFSNPTKDYNLGFTRTVWGKIFNNSIIQEHHIRYNENIKLGEDAVFIIRYCEYIESMKVINDYGYVYRMSNFSSSNRYRKDIEKELEIQLDEILKLTEKYGSSEEINISIVMFILATYAQIENNYHDGMIVGKNSRIEYNIMRLNWINKYRHYLIPLNRRKLSTRAKLQFMAFTLFGTRGLNIESISYRKYCQLKKIMKIIMKK